MVLKESRKKIKGPGYGWKKTPRKKYHYFEKEVKKSLCTLAKYTIQGLKNYTFYSDAEIKPGMGPICDTCYHARKNSIVLHIKKKYTESVGFWDNSHVCPNCKVHVLFFSHGKKEEHHCTICNTMVTLS